MKATLVAANVALAERFGNPLASAILIYEHSTKKFAGSVGSVQKLCDLRGVTQPEGASTWEEIAKVLAEQCDLPLGGLYGDVFAGVPYKEESVKTLQKLCNEFGLAPPVGKHPASWFELIKVVVGLDIELHAAGYTDLSAVHDRLKGLVWEAQVAAVSSGLAQLAQARNGECPSLTHVIAMTKSGVVGMLKSASVLLPGDGEGLLYYDKLELKDLQLRC